jgi:aminoglycoside phosphotransferase (APT) family kinase protein
VVIKVAPPGVEPTLNRDVLRQARLLRALAGSPVAVPRVLLEDPGSPPEVPPLFVMSFVPGDSLEPLFDLDGDLEDAVAAERLRSACRLLASLHSIAPASVGLGDEPVVGAPEEIERWVRLLETVDPALAPGWEGVARALRSTSVEPMAPAIVHGDFRLGNMLAVGGEVTALIDWEIWTVGDPRLDLGWFLINADPETYRRPSRYAGRLPSPAELAERYAEALGRPVPGLAFFEALACFKSTATWSLIVKHNRRRSSPDPDLEAMAASLPRLLERAAELLG